LGLKLAYANASATAVWAPTGIAIAFMILKGYKYWPAVFIGAFLINYTTTWYIPTSISIAAGNTLEGLAGAVLIRNFANGRLVFEKTGTIFRYLLLAGLFSTTISSTLGTFSLCISGFADWNNFYQIWLTWWLGDSAGAILLAPLIIVWTVHHSIKWNLKKFFEGLGVLSLIAALCFVEFTDFTVAGPNHYPFSYLIILPFVWAAFRFSPRAVVTYAFIFCGAAIWGTLNGFGPFVVSTQNESLLFLQASICILTIMSLGYSSVISEGKKIQQSLIETKDVLEERVIERTSELNTLVDALQWEISQRKISQNEIIKRNALVKLLQDITVEANKSSNINEMLLYSIDKICEFTSWPIGHVYMKEKQSKLVPTGIWNSNFSKEFLIFKNVTEEMTFKSYREELLGRIWDKNKPAWVKDINAERNFFRAKVAESVNIRSAFGFPILSENTVVGVLEFFSLKEYEPDKNFIEIMHNIGTQLGRVVERVKYFERLKDGESRYRAVTDSAKDGIMTVNSEGYVSYINPSAEKIFGYHSREISGKPLSILIPDSQVTRYREGLEKYRRTGISNIIGKTIELTGKRKNGEEFPIELSVSQWEANSETYYTGILRDITLRKKSEDQLRTSEKQLKDAQQLAHVGSFEWDIKRDRMFWSDEMFRIFGIFQFEFDGTKGGFLYRVHPDDRQMIKDYIENSLKTASSFSSPVRILLPDGMLRYLQIHGEYILDDYGNVAKLVGACQDISDMKESEGKLKSAQNELLHSEKLASLGRFSSAIAHEIRNPLANISALSQLVIKSDVDEKLKKHLQYILINSDLANKIIKEMLNFASPEDLVPDEEDIAEILNNILGSVKPRCDENKIKIIKEIPDNIHPVFVDRLKLENSFLNFISNSIDAMPGGGELTVKAGQIDRSNCILIEITDTGIGIAAENLDKIFEPFFTTKDKGTGLGMGLSYQTIRLHGGKLSVLSEVGKGTTLKIEVPLKKSSENGKDINH
jgi:PAS domain S-box-containing protein